MKIGSLFCGQECLLVLPLGEWCAVFMVPASPQGAEEIQWQCGFPVFLLGGFLSESNVASQYLHLTAMPLLVTDAFLLDR